MEIVLIRHGPPDFNGSRWLLRHRMRDLLDEYAKSRMFSQPPAETVAFLAQCSTGKVACSTLARSIDSARALGHPSALQIRELDEAELPCLPWKFPASYRVMAVAMRIAWFLGYSGNGRSYSSTRDRARAGAVRLAELAKCRGVLAVGHGIMNSLVSRQLVASGWSISERSGSGYWSITRLCRAIPAAA